MRTRPVAVAVCAAVCCLASAVQAFQTELQFYESSWHLRDLCFPVRQKGWAVGLPHWDADRKEWTGTIIVTEDGGDTWRPQEAASGAALNGVCFTDDRNGWAVGEQGTVQKTRDGGATWVRKDIDTQGECYGVFFTDALHGFVTVTEAVHFGWFGDADDWRGSIWRTADGGESWEPSSVPESTGILKRVTFIDGQRGWAAGTFRGTDPITGGADHRSALYATSDGGRTWQRKFNHELDITMTDVEFTDALNGWAVGFITNSGEEGGNLFHTTDGGATWERLDQGGFSQNFWDVDFLDADRGVITGTFYPAAWGPPVLRTMDGGRTWETVRMEMHDGEGLFGVAVFANRLLAVGDNDYRVRSGRPWEASASPEDLFSQDYLNVHYRFEDIFFADASNGWVVGSRSYGPDIWGQVIFHTGDGGRTWEKQFERSPDTSFPLMFSNFRLDKVVFTDPLNGWAVGNTGMFYADGWSNEGSVYHTTDGGAHWIQQGGTLGSTELFSVQFLDGDSGWAVNNGSPSIRFARTEDAGENWRWVETGIEKPLGIGFATVQGDLFFTDALYGWAAGGLGTVVRTTDGGATWQDLEATNSLSYRHCIAVQFLDRMNGWIAGEGLFHTADGGATWSIVQLPVDVLDLHDIQFTDNRRGWTAGDGGVILMTDDGGDTWLDEQSGARIAADLKGLSFVNDSTGWACGHAGAILKITGGREPSGVARDRTGDRPAGFALLPNYPNPFNGSTVLRFKLERPAFVRLRIFDALGREAAGLVSGVQSAGIHHVRWNPTGLPSGVYMARLEVSDPLSPGRMAGTSIQKMMYAK
ncbi:MAG: YCF48-related protein [bacterium]|nr:YCF48-related protein [bacterium]